MVSDFSFKLTVSSAPDRDSDNRSYATFPHETESDTESTTQHPVNFQSETFINTKT